MVNTLKLGMDAWGKEAHIKAAVLQKLREQGSITRRATIANEFAVGRSSVRADLAILGSRFVGVEIKSERDSLRRLQRQLAVYKGHFDQTIVVLAARHLEAASQFVPQGVDIWRFDSDGSLHVLSEVSSDVAPEDDAFTGLLTQAEAKRWSHLSPRMALHKAFQEKYGPTSKAFWYEVARKKITSDHLRILSRFLIEREEERLWHEVRAAEWSRWEEHARVVLPRLVAA